jgi:hypothetical protein
MESAKVLHDFDLVNVFSVFSFALYVNHHSSDSTAEALA